MIYRVTYTLTDGSVHFMDDRYDEEWAGRIAHQLRQCADVVHVEITDPEPRLLKRGQGGPESGTAIRAGIAAVFEKTAINNSLPLIGRHS